MTENEAILILNVRISRFDHAEDVTYNWRMEAKRKEK